MKGLLKDRGIKRVFILGAGFSAPLGMPLTPDLLKLTHNVAKTKNRSKNRPYGQADWLLGYLKFYYPTKEFTHDMIENKKSPLDFDIEQFLSLASATSAYGEDWSDGDDQFISFCKAWIAEAIFNEQQKSLRDILLSGQIPPQYSLFVDCLKSSMVITFNWDTILEHMMQLRSCPYVCGINPWQSLAYMESVDDTWKSLAYLESVDKNDSGYKVPILKLHGSIDWTSASSSARVAQDWECLTPDEQDDNKIFRVSGACLKDHFANINTRYLAVPKIVIPGYDKIHQIKKLGSLWDAPWEYFNDDLEIVIIGFSMREDDLHSRAFIYPKLVQGSRDGYLKVKVIDRAVNYEQQKKIRKLYQGVENCQFWFDGFNENIHQFIEK